MACVLRISATTEIITRLVKRNFIPPIAVFDESVTLSVSDANLLDYEQQIEDAFSFLDSVGEQLSDICASFGVDSLCLDFAFGKVDEPIQGFTFPADLLSLAGNYGIDIEVSLYQVSDETVSN